MTNKNTVEDSHYRDNASSGSVDEAAKEEAKAPQGQIGQHLHKRYQAGHKHEAQK
ncbi:MAG: hypothetical protein Q4P33_07145 [Flaviflexus sp.]|nr:hypothetical protein [Flaviflexus sp.]